MKRFDLPSLLAKLPGEEPALQMLTPLNGCMLGVVRFATRTVWECHPDGDELLHVLAGEVAVTVLPERPADPAVESVLRAGSVFVVPKGLWHRQEPRPSVELLFATAVATTRHSGAADPRAVSAG